MTGFGIETVIGLKEVTSYQAARWDFGNFFDPFGIPKIIIMNEDGVVSGIFKNNLQDNLLIPVHAVTRFDHKSIIYKGFHRYLNKLQMINSADKGVL